MRLRLPRLGISRRQHNAALRLLDEVAASANEIVDASRAALQKVEGLERALADAETALDHLTEVGGAAQDYVKARVQAPRQPARRAAYDRLVKILEEER